MKTIINGVEITPQMGEVLHRWFDCELAEDIQPFVYVKLLARTQDYLTRVWVDKYDDDEDIPELKEGVSCLLDIKNDLSRFIPDKKTGKTDETA
jgi:hypothetical protein